jgi:hypothetical protein
MVRCLGSRRTDDSSLSLSDKDIGEIKSLFKVRHTAHLTALQYPADVTSADDRDAKTLQRVSTVKRNGGGRSSNWLGKSSARFLSLVQMTVYQLASKVRELFGVSVWTIYLEAMRNCTG